MPATPPTTFELAAFLANQVRINIVRELSQQSRTVNELVEITGLSQSALSQHLKRMLVMGVLTRVRQGNFRIYSCESDACIKLAGILDEFVANIQPETDAVDA